MSREARGKWVEVCTREYEMLRSGKNTHPFLDPYAAVNPGEFFAVATEFFLDRPVQMERYKPELYEVLREFYRQDTARRQRNHDRSS
jgi:Mlc titration factor MtfA (ptsG expression regulator)